MRRSTVDASLCAASVLLLAPFLVSCSPLQVGATFALEQHPLHSVLHPIVPVQFQPDPVNFDFWKEAEKIGVSNLTTYADNAIKEEALNFGYTTTTTSSSSFLDSVDDFKSLMQGLISSAEALNINSGSASVQDVAFIKEFNEKLSLEIEKIETWIMETFHDVPEDSDGESKEERYARRADAVDKTLDKIEDAFVRTYALWDITEEEGRSKFGKVRPHIQSAVLAVGTFAENHPLIVDAVLFAAAVMIVPEGFFLRGALRLFGFGPLGPTKGSVAAWAQRYFFGAAVKEGSWFSRLQRAGMRWWGR